MRIEDALRQIHSLPDAWIRVDQVRRVPRGLEVSFGVFKGRRGGKASSWRIGCRGVREFQIVDLDGGGLALYPSTHPAALQFVARRAVVRWNGCDGNAAIEALQRAHREAAGDWIPLGSDLSHTIEEGKFVCQGPDFLMRAYARALRSIGASPRLTLGKKRTAKAVRPRVLHFGSSSIVADEFVAEALD